MHPQATWSLCITCFATSSCGVVPLALEVVMRWVNMGGSLSLSPSLSPYLSLSLPLSLPLFLSLSLSGGLFCRVCSPHSFSVRTRYRACLHICTAPSGDINPSSCSASLYVWDQVAAASPQNAPWHMCFAAPVPMPSWGRMRCTGCWCSGAEEGKLVQAPM